MRLLQYLRRGFVLLFWSCSILGVFVLLIVFVIPKWQFNTLERQLKANVKPAELQKWAYDFLDNYSGKSWEYYGTRPGANTNVPPGIEKVSLFSEGMHVSVSPWKSRSVTIFGLGKHGPFVEVGMPPLPSRTNRAVIHWTPEIQIVGE